MSMRFFTVWCLNLCVFPVPKKSPPFKTNHKRSFSHSLLLLLVPTSLQSQPHAIVNHLKVWHPSKPLIHPPLKKPVQNSCVCIFQKKGNTHKFFFFHFWPHMSLAPPAPPCVVVSSLCNKRFESLPSSADLLAKTPLWVCRGQFLSLWSS